MKFTKMQGCGNDYVFIDCFAERLGDIAAFARFVSNRNFGVGSDGLICIGPSDNADFKMEMYNSDGSPAQMCGNGIRCLAKYVYDKGLTDKSEIAVETGNQIKRLLLNIKDREIESVRVDMGSPELRPQFIPIAEHGINFINRSVIANGREYFLTAVNVGNPHAVTFVDEVDNYDVQTIGPMFENHPLFPERVNVEFVQLIDRKTLKMRVWERGSGETLACGTGATAAVVAAILNGFTDNKVKVILRGGELFIEWDRENDKIYMTGPAVTVFDGELYLQNEV